MAELPEYKRQIRLNNAGSSGSFQNAMGNVGQANMELASIGSELAQRSSDEQSRLAGIEAAQTNKRQLFAPFTQSDKAFYDAYRQEEYNSIIYEGHRYLNESFQEASKNPSNKSLNAFQQNAQRALADLTQNSQVDLAPELKRQLGQIYDSKYSQLANAVEAKNRAFMVANFNRSYEANLDNMANFHLEGNHEAAKEAYEQNLKSIKNAVSNGLISPDQAYKQEKIARLRNQEAYYQYHAIEAQKEGRAEEYMKDFLLSEPSHLTPLEHQDVLQKTQSLLNQRNAYLHGQQAIDYLHAEKDLANGTLTPSALIDYQEKLSPQDFARLELKIAQQTEKQVKDTQLFSEMVESFGDVTSMSKFTDKQVDTVFSKLVQQNEEYISEQMEKPYKLSLIDEASVAQNIKHNISSLSNKLSDTLQYADATKATEAARAYRMLQENNPIAVSSMDKNSIAVANLFDQYSRNTSYSPEDSLKAARNQVYNVDENKKRERIEVLKQFKSDNSLLDFKSKAKHVAKGLGAEQFGFWNDNKKVPAGLNAVYDDLMQSMTIRVGDPKVAEQMVFDELKKVYKSTNTNNRPEIMKYPPEMELPNVGYFQQNDKVRALKEIVEKNQEASKKGQVLNVLEWPDAPDTSDLITKPLVEGDLKIKVDGKWRKVIVASDINTDLPYNGKRSWAFSYVNDQGQEIPIMDTNLKAGVARWYPKLDAIENYQKDYKARQLKKAQEIRDDTAHPSRPLIDYYNPNVEERFKWKN